jgi:N6-adenosine-specific RNA methylase IME4
VQEFKIIRVPLAEIKCGGRHRKHLGDVDSLAASIEAVGLLHPIVLTTDKRLIAGERRIAAVRKLAWPDVPATIAEDLAEAGQLLAAERDENQCRKDLLPSEYVQLGEALEALEKPEAKSRQQTGRPKADTVTPGKFTGHNKGDIRDRVGAALGVSGPVYEKAKEIVAAARTDPNKYGAFAEAMDRTGKVSGAHKRLKVAQAAENIRAEPPPLPTGPFRVIVVDPPWTYDVRANDTTHRANLPYPSMSLDEIAALPVKGMAAADCILWLWTTNAHMPDAFRILEAWDFSHKTILTWVKDRMGTGDWLRGQTEHCLVAVRGRPVVTLTNQTTAINGPVREHSRKPEGFYALVEALCPGSKCELFQRVPRKTWVGHGNEQQRFSD